MSSNPWPAEAEAVPYEELVFVTVVHGHRRRLSTFVPGEELTLRSEQTTSRARSWIAWGWSVSVEAHADGRTLYEGSGWVEPEASRPNGPGCQPTVYGARVDAVPDGRLVLESPPSSSSPVRLRESLRGGVPCLTMMTQTSQTLGAERHAPGHEDALWATA